MEFNEKIKQYKEKLDDHLCELLDDLIDKAKDSHLKLNYQFIKEKKLASEIPDDLLSLIRRTVAIRKHLETNHKDESAKRGLTLTESLIKRLTKYYKHIGKLASEWKFDPERAGFYTK